MDSGWVIDAEDYLGEAKVVGVTESTTVRVSCLGNEFMVGRGILDELKLTLYYGQRVEVES